MAPRDGKAKHGEAKQRHSEDLSGYGNAGLSVAEARLRCAIHGTAVATKGALGIGSGIDLTGNGEAWLSEAEA